MEEILKFIERDDLRKYVGNWSDEPFSIPFDLKSEDFIKFVEADLKNTDRRTLVNALGNIKRSIDCRLDSLLFLFGYYKKIKKENWSFPRKIKLLEDLQIITPRILSKINTKRNKLEHEYKVPNQEEVQDALDIANLFILSTEKFLNKTFTNFEWELIDNKDNWPWVDVKLDSKKGLFQIELIEGKGKRKKIEVTIEDEENYRRVLNQWIYCLKKR